MDPTVIPIIGKNEASKFQGLETGDTGRNPVRWLHENRLGEGCTVGPMFIPTPTAVKRVVIVIDPPTPSGPMFVHTRLFAFVVLGATDALWNEIFVGSNASVNGTGLNATGLVFETVMVNDIVSPTAAGLPVGLNSDLTTVKLAVTAEYGTLDVEGGTGTLFVVVGATAAVFVPNPALTDVNRAVTMVEPPTANGPTFVHESVPATRFVKFAPGDCEAAVNWFVK